MSVKFKESTQLYNFFHVATPIATTVYYKYRLILTYMNEPIQKTTLKACTTPLE